MRYVSLEGILPRLLRELAGVDVEEGDAIEMVGEALEFMRVPSSLENAVSFQPVTRHETWMPKYLQAVLQIARYNGPTDGKDCNPSIVIAERCDTDVEPDTGCGCGGARSVAVDVKGQEANGLSESYDCYVCRKIPYQQFVSSTLYRENFTPVRLANHSFFNSIVSEERLAREIYRTCQDEYTIVGTLEKRFRFSFDSGYVAISYYRPAIDDATGFPMIPDDPSVHAAISYYVRWKLSERWQMMGKMGAGSMVQQNMNLWWKYVRQAKNRMKMPRTVDELENTLEQTHRLIPRRMRYYGYFGHLAVGEQLNLG